MPCFCYQDGGTNRCYKLWRYPGVPIPHRLQSTYSSDPKRCRKPAQAKSRLPW